MDDTITGQIPGLLKAYHKALAEVTPKDTNPALQLAVLGIMSAELIAKSEMPDIFLKAYMFTIQMGVDQLRKDSLKTQH